MTKLMNITLRDGLKLQLRTLGAGEPLLMLHGFMGASSSWGEQLLAVLAGDYQVIALDLLGHGQSDKATQPARYAIAEIVADICDVLNALHIRRTHLLGYSMGGRVALACAVLAPERVKRLVLESSSPGLASRLERQARQQSDEALAKRLEARGMEPFVDDWEKLPLFASQRRLPEALRRQIRAVRLTNDPLALAACLRGLGTGVQPSFWRALPTISHPTRLLCGAEDDKFVAINRKMLRALPEAHLDIIPDTGHTVHLEQPEAWLRAVRQHL